MSESTVGNQSTSANFDTTSVNQDQQIVVFFENREQEVAEFLKHQKIMDAYAMGQDTFAAIDSAASPQEKVAAFQDSPLNKYRTYMENEGSNFTQEERVLLDIVNNKLAGNKAIKTLLLGEGLGARKGLLLEAIEQQLDSKSVGDVISDEMFHYRSVYQLAKEAFPGNIVLQIAALLHDSHKYDANGRRQLGLHELASTVTAAELTRQSLQLLVEKNLIDLESEEIEVVVKAVARATYTHGMGEYPAETSASSPAEGSDFLFWLGEELYARPGSTSVPEDFAEEPDTLSATIAGTNLADMLTGSDTPSFKKYNMSWETSILAGTSLTAYLEQYILVSFNSNILSTAYLYYAEHVQGPEDNVIIEKINIFVERAALLQFLLDSDGSFKSTITTHLTAFAKEHPGLVQQAEEVKAAFRAIRPVYEPFGLVETTLTQIKQEMEELTLQRKEIEATFPPNKSAWILQKRWDTYVNLQQQLARLAQDSDSLLTVYSHRAQAVDAARHTFDQAFGHLVDAVIEEYTPADVQQAG